MGDALMKQVARDWGHLPGNAYKVLMVMCSCAMDDAKPPIYFGGWERLASTGLGRLPDWPADADQSESAQRFRKTSEELVRRAIQALIKKGAIATHKHGRLGVRAEYALLLPQRFVGSLPQQNVAGGQQIVAGGQQNVGANSQQSFQHPQAAKPISPMGVRHQGDPRPVDNRRSTQEQLDARRAQLEAEQVA